MGQGGERHGCHLGRSSRHQLHEPGPPSSVPLGIADDRHRSDDEQLSQVAIAGLEDTAEPFLSRPKPARRLPEAKGGEPPLLDKPFNRAEGPLFRFATAILRSDFRLVGNTSDHAPILIDLADVPKRRRLWP